MVFMTFHILGMSWSQLTHIFQRGRLNHQPENLHRIIVGPAGTAQLKSRWEDRRSIGAIDPSAGTSGTNTCSTRNPRKRTSRMPKKWHKRQNWWENHHFYPFFMGRSTISTGPFSIATSNYQRQNGRPGILWVLLAWRSLKPRAGSVPGVRHMLSVPVPQDGEGWGGDSCCSYWQVAQWGSSRSKMFKCTAPNDQLMWSQNWNMTLITQCAPTLPMCIYTITFNSI